MLYAAALAWRAWSELTEDYVVEGLFRTYHPPRALPIGWLFDVRTGTLSDEIDRRFETRGPPPTDDSPDAWRTALEARGFAVSAGRGHGDGAPRLVFPAGGPWLVTGRAQQRPIVFDPKRGMLLLEEGVIPPDTPALALRR